MDRFQMRLNKELLQLNKVKDQHGWVVEEDQTNRWTVSFDGPKNSIYKHDGTFSLSFEFPTTYPLVAPLVRFVGDNIPIHPHIYSNGRICLSILDEEWLPVLKVESVTLSIISMLCSATVKTRPQDNERFVRELQSNLKKAVNFDYHDDRV